MDFPALVPSSRSYTSGDYAVRTFRSQSGAESRILYGDTRFGATLELQYQNLTDKNAQTFVGHYENVKGTFGTFELPLRLIEGWSGNAQLIGTGYRNQRNSIATYIDQDGFIVTAQPFETRFSYETETGHPIGLLIEDEATNLFTNSTSPTTGIFSFNWDVSPSDILGPDNKLIEVSRFINKNPVAGSGFTRINGSFEPGQYFVSIYIYVPSQSSISSWLIKSDFFNVDRGSSIDYSVFNKWVRAVVPVEVVATRSFVDFDFIVSGRPTRAGDEFYAWGPQVERGVSVSSYIPTGSDPVTRQADKLQPIGSWRYAEPPEITNVRPGVSNARVRLISVV